MIPALMSASPFGILVNNLVELSANYVSYILEYFTHSHFTTILASLVEVNQITSLIRNTLLIKFVSYLI